MAASTDVTPAQVTWNPIKTDASGRLAPTGPRRTSHGRQNSASIPDIVDNENCFQPVDSDSSTDLTANPGSRPTSQSEEFPSQHAHSIPTQPQMATSGQSESGGGEERTPANPSGSSSELRPSVVLSPSSRYTESGVSDSAIRVRNNSGGHPYVPQHANFRQIQTQDLNAGIVTRLEPHNHRHEALPDLLHSHVIPPPVVSARQNQHRHQDRRTQNAQDAARHHSRHTHRDGRSSRSGHRSGHRRRSRSHTTHSEPEPCKESCFKCLAASTSFRWILVILSLLGVCCVVTGIVLAALHAAGNSFLFLAIMFIGLGVLLVVVVAVGWKCTPRGHEPLHALFNLGDFRRPRERRQPRQHRSREGHWYGGVLYPEFQYRRPPPSYSVSMQEYQQQLMMAQQNSHTNDNPDNPDDYPEEDYSLPSSPPPSYRSRASTVRTGVHITFPPQAADSPDSRPPTYRSHSSTLHGPQRHSRPSLPLDQEANSDRARVADVAFTGQGSFEQQVFSTGNPSPGGIVHAPTVADSEVQVNLGDVAMEISSSNAATIEGVNNIAEQVERTLQVLDETITSSVTPETSAENGADSATADASPGTDEEYPIETAL